MSTVLVTGANGFCAQHIIRVLLEHKYTVIGSVRSSAKGDALRANFASDAFSYIVVPDLGVRGAFIACLRAHPEIRYFLHTATPVNFGSTDPARDLLVPAVEGLKDVLATIHEYGKNIQKVVYTSSVAAVTFSNQDTADASEVVTEASWNPITWEQATENPLYGYRGSKTFAERAAWEFMAKEKPRFSLTTVVPPYVFGPQAFRSEVREVLNSSNELISGFLKAAPDEPVLEFGWSFIDVRDVARAHLAAVEKQSLSGERVIVSNGRFSTQLILDIIHKRFPQVEGNIPRGEPGVYKEFGVTIDDSKSRALLGLDYIPFEQTVTDVVQQIIDSKIGQ